MRRACFCPSVFLALLFTLSPAEGAERAGRILFFSKSSGFEHSVISYKGGQPSHAEKVLQEIGVRQGWQFVFSKDGSLFSPAYLDQFGAIFFYTTGDLTTPGTDGQPPMSAAGKQALLDYVRRGGGFVGTHSASDTFHTGNESKKGPERYRNYRLQADDYVQMLGGEFIKHGPQQVARQRTIDAKFPGLGKYADGFGFQEEWYSLKDFPEDIHVLLVQETDGMKGPEYQRPPFPSTWIRQEQKGRVFYTSMGHREDVWTNPIFQDVLIGGIRWTLREVEADATPNLLTAAPGALTNPPYVAPPPPKATPAPRSEK